MKHMAANRRGINEKAGSVNQSSLAITQFGFMGFGLLMPEKLGIKIKDPKDVEGFVHFWRAIGYLVGVDDQLSVVIVKIFSESKKKKRFTIPISYSLQIQHLQRQRRRNKANMSKDT